MALLGVRSIQYYVPKTKKWTYIETNKQDKKKLIYFSMVSIKT